MDEQMVTITDERFRGLLMDASLLKELFEVHGSENYGEVLAVVRRSARRRSKKPEAAGEENGGA